MDEIKVELENRAKSSSNCCKMKATEPGPRNGTSK